MTLCVGFMPSKSHRQHPSMILDRQFIARFHLEEKNTKGDLKQRSLFYGNIFRGERDLAVASLARDTFSCKGLAKLEKSLKKCSYVFFRY